MDSASNPPIIMLKNLKKSFGFGDAEIFALNGIDLTVKRGEFIAIMGPSGCGKTTLLNTIGLLDGDFVGDYELEGKDVTVMSRNKHARIRSKRIGFIFQNYNLVSRMNVIDNVALPLTYKGIPKTRRLIMASNILKNFHLGEREFYMPYQLSGGQAQRVAIARALVSEPSIILADEPTGSLDSKSSHAIMEELCTLHRLGNTIIMVTHNPSLTSYASRVITMMDGQIDTDSMSLIKLEQISQPEFEEAPQEIPVEIAPDVPVEVLQSISEEFEQEAPSEVPQKKSKKKKSKRSKKRKKR